MVPEPTVGSVTALIELIQKIFSSYSAYKVGAINETDQGLRNEVRRRISMVQAHINTVEQRAVEMKLADVLSVVTRVQRACSLFDSDVQMGISGTSTSTNRGASKPSKKMIKDLISSDYEILQRLVESTRMANAIVDGLHTTPEQSNTILLELEQKLTGIRNRYLDRNALLGEIN